MQDEILDHLENDEVPQQALTGPLWLRPWPLFVIELLLLAVFTTFTFLAFENKPFIFLWASSAAALIFFYCYTPFYKADQSEIRLFGTVLTILGIIAVIGLIYYAIKNVFPGKLTLFGSIGIFVLSYIILGIQNATNSLSQYRQYPFYLLAAGVLGASAFFIIPVSFINPTTYSLTLYLLACAISAVIFIILLIMMIYNWTKYRFLLYYINRLLLLLIIQIPVVLHIFRRLELLQ